MSPPGTLTRPTLSGERITAGHDLETRNGQRRFLCDRFGVTQREARQIIARYEVAKAAEDRTEFYGWLMSQAPGPGRQRGVIQRQWRVTSA